MNPFVWETKGETERKVGLVARMVKKGGQCKSPEALGKGDLGSIAENRCPGEAQLEATWAGRRSGSEGDEQAPFRQDWPEREEEKKNRC